MRSCWYLAITLRPLFLRFSLGRHAPGQPPQRRSWAYHVPMPLGEPGVLVARTLDRLAEQHGDDCGAPGLVGVLLRMALQHAQRCAGEQPGKAAATWRRVQEHVSMHCHQELSRGSVAAELGLSANYLSNLCHQQAGYGFARLVETVRLERARRMLRTAPHLSIRTIAEQNGFASAGYFARVFRRATGFSPVAWRNR